MPAIAPRKDRVRGLALVSLGEMRKFLLLSGLLLAWTATAGEPYVYNATVVTVHDGDTLKVDIDLGFRVTLRGVDLRLQDVFAPELNEPGGIPARDKLRALIPAGSKVLVQTVRTKGGSEVVSFQRYVARVLVDKTEMNEVMSFWLTGEGLAGGTGIRK